MNHTELRTIIAGLGLSQAGVATLIGVSRRSVARWATGEAPIPAPIAMLFRMLAQDTAP